MNKDDINYLVSESAKRGYDPLQLATVLHYESGLNPAIWGGKDNKYYGVLQFGPEERKQFGIDTQNPSFRNQLDGAFKFFEARGYQPSMGFADLYSTVSAGSPGHYRASDGNNTVNGHVASMLRSSLPEARKLLEGAGYQADAAQISALQNAPHQSVMTGNYAAPASFGMPQDYSPSFGSSDQTAANAGQATPRRPLATQAIASSIGGLLGQAPAAQPMQDDGFLDRMRQFHTTQHSSAMRGLLG